jgi:hypothetical protein
LFPPPAPHIRRASSLGRRSCHRRANRFAMQKAHLVLPIQVLSNESQGIHSTQENSSDARPTESNSYG